VFGGRWETLPEWITTQEAVQLSGYDIQYIRWLAREGKIGAEKKGRDWWIDRDQFRAYLEAMLASDDGRAGPRPD
jgi:excisionase family DNA binding protein